MENSKDFFKRRYGHWKVCRLANINDIKEDKENTSINWRKGVKEWHVVDDDMGSVENLIKDLKDLSTDEEEILILEQMITDSKLINLAKSTEIENWNTNINR